MTLDARTVWRHKNKDKINAQQRAWRSKHKLKMHLYHKSRYKSHIEEIKKSKKLYRSTHKGTISKYNKEYYQKNKTKISAEKKEYLKSYFLLNKDRIYTHLKKRRETDPEFYIKHCLRSRLNTALRICQGKKQDRLIDLIGCSYSFLKDHLEKTFTEGMSWDRRKELHIDHIIPCCAFDLTLKEEQRRCFHYTNLRMLWSQDNLNKRIEDYKIRRVAA